jgi:hypothetical protein
MVHRPLASLFHGRPIRNARRRAALEELLDLCTGCCGLRHTARSLSVHALKFSLAKGAEKLHCAAMLHQETLIPGRTCVKKSIFPADNLVDEKFLNKKVVRKLSDLTQFENLMNYQNNGSNLRLGMSFRPSFYGT